ncbi:hypothetical protein Hamer_G031482, partial [Homarus americanus]
GIGLCSCWPPLWAPRIQCARGIKRGVRDLKQQLQVHHQMKLEVKGSLTNSGELRRVIGEMLGTHLQDERTDDEVSDDENKNLTLNNLGEVIRMSKALSARLL